MLRRCTAVPPGSAQQVAPPAVDKGASGCSATPGLLTISGPSLHTDATPASLLLATDMVIGLQTTQSLHKYIMPTSRNPSARPRGGWVCRSQARASGGGALGCRAHGQHGGCCGRAGLPGRPERRLPLGCLRRPQPHHCCRSPFCPCRALALHPAVKSASCAGAACGIFVPLLMTTACRLVFWAD